MTLKTSPDYSDLEVKVHLATEPDEAVPLSQLQSLVTAALRYKGPVSPTGSAPASPATGDVYVFDAAGTVPWLNNQKVTLHEAIFWDGKEWDLMGASTTGTLIGVTGKAPIVIGGTATTPEVQVTSGTDVREGVVRFATTQEVNAGATVLAAVQPFQLATINQSITNALTRADDAYNNGQTNTTDIANNKSGLIQINSNVYKALVATTENKNNIAHSQVDIQANKDLLTIHERKIVSDQANWVRANKDIADLQLHKAQAELWRKGEEAIIVDTQKLVQKVESLLHDLERKVLILEQNSANHPNP